MLITLLVVYLSKSTKRENISEIQQVLGELMSYSTATGKVDDLHKAGLISLSRRGKQKRPSLNKKGKAYLDWWQQTQDEEAEAIIAEVEGCLEKKNRINE